MWLNDALPSSPRSTPQTAAPVWRSAAFTVGFLPAFRDDDSGEVHLCLEADGRIADLHLLDGLPNAWIAQHDRGGRPLSLVPGIRAGYLRAGRFWTLDNLKHPTLDG